MATPSGGSSVTLVFYRVGEKWWKEPALNLVAAVCQWSPYTHVEIAIGEAPGENGMMANVARVFNDAVGVELIQRTGKNPAYTYFSLGCSHTAEQAMLQFAAQQVGKPFSNLGMARSLVLPRMSDHSSWFCAELVAAILQRGGLLSRDSNPGAATPYSLYNMYSKQAAATANPYTLRGMNLTLGGQPMATRPGRATREDRVPLLDAPSESASTLATPLQPLRTGVTTSSAPRGRADSPPRASFKVVSNRGDGSALPLAALGAQAPLHISLNLKR